MLQWFINAFLAGHPVIANHFDQDGDGFGRFRDCDGDDPNVHPDADEICDGVDNDCDGVVDDAEITWYWDGDLDGYGQIGSGSVIGDCEDAEDGYLGGSPEWILVEGDCDGANPDTYPGATELLDGLDNDCDGEVVCEFEVEVIDAYGVETTTFAANEPHFTLHSSSPSGAAVPDTDQEIMRFNVIALHSECPDVLISELSLEVTSTDNAGTFWNDALWTELVNLSTGDSLFYNTLPNAEPAPLEIVETVPAGTTYTFGVYIDTFGASATDDDAIMAELLSNSVIVEIDGIEYWLANDLVEGVALVF